MDGMTPVVPIKRHDLPDDECSQSVLAGSVAFLRIGQGNG